MPEVSPQRPTAEPITAVIAERVRAARVEAGISQAELADRMTELGVPWKRATVVNLEKRAAGSRGSAGAGRDAVTVQELLALALAVDLPPVMLLADPRHVDQLPVSGEAEIDVWTTLLWIIGWQALNDAPSTRWSQSMELVRAITTAIDMVGELERPPVHIRTPDGQMIDMAKVLTDSSYRDSLRRAVESGRNLGAAEMPQDIVEASEPVDLEKHYADMRAWGATLSDRYPDGSDSPSQQAGGQ